MTRKIHQLGEAGSKVEIRELAPEKFWGARIRVENLTSFQEAITKSAKESNFTYSGFLVGDEYVMTRYPRRAFGPVASIDQHQKALNTLENNLGVQGKEEETTLESKFRVLLGLEEGYAEYQKNMLLNQLNQQEATVDNVRSNILELFGGSVAQAEIKEMNKSQLIDLLSNTNLSKKHSIEEVRTILGDKFDLEDAKIYTVGSWGSYQEPAVVITGKKEDIEKVYELAEKFHQSRIAVEDLQNGKAYMTETKYCSDPDKE